MDKKLLSNIIWAFTGQVGYIFIGLVGSLILARLLTPEDFGLVGIGMFFVGVFNVLVESGMGGALVRKENVTDKDYSTIFIFNLVVSIFLVLLLIISSHYIAEFYNQESLTLVLITLSSILLINAFTITQNVKLVKEMQFKKRGLYKFISLFLAVLISIYIGYLGGGVWAIVAMQVLSAFFLMLILWIREGGIVNLVFSKESFKEMSSFGLFTTLSTILNAIFDNIYQLILGKYFSIGQVGFYYQAKKLQDAPATAFNLVISNVFYAHLSKLQSKLIEFKVSYNKIAKVCAIFSGLTTCLIYVYAEEIVLIVLGEKWIGSIFYLQILVVSGFFTLQEMVNRNIFKIFDQTHKILYLEIFKKSIQTISIIIGIIYNDITLLLYGLIVTSIISYFINFYFSRKIVDGVSQKEITGFLKIVLIAVITTWIINILTEYLKLITYTKLLILPLFLLIYFLLLHMLKVQSLSNISKYKTFLKNK